MIGKKNWLVKKRRNKFLEIPWSNRPIKSCTKNSETTTKTKMWGSSFKEGLKDQQMARWAQGSSSMSTQAINLTMEWTTPISEKPSKELECKYFSYNLTLRFSVRRQTKSTSGKRMRLSITQKHMSSAVIPSERCDQRCKFRPITIVKVFQNQQL